MYHSYQSPKKSSLLFPFLIIIVAGIIGLLGVKLYGNIFAEKSGADTYFYMAQGDAKVLPWGMQEWQKAYHGSKALQGDSFQTGADSYAALNFWNKTSVRMDSDTSVMLTRVKEDSEEDFIELSLSRGQVWVNIADGEKPIRMSVETPKTVVRAKGTIFSVEVREAEITRVIRGNVEADVMTTEEDKKKVLTTIEVGVGQEMTLVEKDYDKFLDRETPSVLNALSDTFKQTPFFTWNAEQDFRPTNFSTSEPLPAGALSIPTVVTLPETEEKKETVSPLEVKIETVKIPAVKLPAPVITEPAPDKRTVTSPFMKILGTVAAGSAKVTVTWKSGSQSNVITLSKFKAGDKSFQYGAQEGYNLTVGENTYTVVTYDKDGNASDPAQVTVTFKK